MAVKVKTPFVSADKALLREALRRVEEEAEIYREIIRDFQARYGCDLVELEARIKRKELPEHPTWEDSIEWGVAEDELRKITEFLQADGKE